MIASGANEQFMKELWGCGDILARSGTKVGFGV
jgi:hypothetical protein